MEDAFAPSHSSNAIHMLAFDFENTSYAIPELEVKGMKNYAAYLDGEKINGSSLHLRPGSHNIVLRYLSAPDRDTDSLSVYLKSENNAGFSLRNDGVYASTWRMYCTELPYPEVKYRPAVNSYLPPIPLPAEAVPQHAQTR